MSDSVDLILDPQIRNYVLVPITVAMVFYGVMQHHVRTLLTDKKKSNLDAIQTRHNVERARRLRANGRMLDQTEFHMRKEYFLEKNDGVFVDKNIHEEPVAQDPTAMMGMLKMQMAGMFQFMGMMFVVNYFFSGFVCLRLPFTLTGRFKPMLQRGMVLFGLDMSWVSSLSWQVLNQFGLKGVHMWILDTDDVMDSFAIQQQQMGMGAGGGGGPQGPQKKKLYLAEADNLNLTSHRGTILGDVEQKLIASM